MKETGELVTPLQVAATLSAAAAFIDEVVYKTQDAQVVERLEGYIEGSAILWFDPFRRRGT
jgi:hypothetical protein